MLASCYAGDGRFLGALGSSTILILTHVGSAVVPVLSGFVILQRTIGGAGRAPTLEHASQALIVLVGLWLLWRAFRPHSHDHDASGPALALLTGLVPCPLTTFIGTITQTAETENTRSYQRVLWLPFLDTYRTMCLAPQPDFRRVLEDVRAMQLAA